MPTRYGNGNNNDGNSHEKRQKIALTSQRLEGFI